MIFHLGNLVGNPMLAPSLICDKVTRRISTNMGTRQGQVKLQLTNERHSPANFGRSRHDLVTFSVMNAQNVTEHQLQNPKPLPLLKKIFFKDYALHIQRTFRPKRSSFFSATKKIRLVRKDRTLFEKFGIQFQKVSQ